MPWNTSGSTTIDPNAHIISGSTTTPSQPLGFAIVELRVNVDRRLFERLKKVAGRRALSVTDALQEALITYLSVQDYLQQGKKFLTADRQGLQQVFFDCIGEPVPPTTARTVQELLAEIRRG